MFEDPHLIAPERHPPTRSPLQERRFQGIPGIEATADGRRLWACWYAGGPDQPTEGAGNFIVLSSSTDGGVHWEEAQLLLPSDMRYRAFDGCLWRAPDGRLWLFLSISGPRRDGTPLTHDGRGGVWVMHTDEAHLPQPRWSPPVRISDGVMMNKPTLRSNGEWLLPVALWHFRPGEYEYDTGANSGAWVVVSDDHGATWTHRGRAIAQKRVYDEHQVLERRDGSLWMLIRTMEGIVESTSTDGGAHWSPPRQTHLQTTSSRFFLRRLACGRALLVHHLPPAGLERDPQERAYLTARLSEDDGLSWSPGFLLDERIHVSYPDGTQLADGTLLIIYDHDRHQKGEILLARVTPEEIATGHQSQAGSFLRQQVSSIPPRHP